VRLPLFRRVMEEEADGVKTDSNQAVNAYAGTAERHVLKDQIFLPESTSSRLVHYLPPKATSSGKVSNMATVIVGSHLPASSGRTFAARYEKQNPLGLFVDEKEQLGGWTKVTKEDEESKIPASVGRLQGKFEEFDKSDDCDIVPYLV